MVMPGASTGAIKVNVKGDQSVTASGTFSLTQGNFPSGQQGAKLVGSGNIGVAQQGFSVALSADGKTAIVGAVMDDNKKGAVWIYNRTGTTWIQHGDKLVGTGSLGESFQGQSVALSADGNTAIVGGMGDNNYQGAVWVFTRTGSNWTQQGNKLVGTGNVGAANQGSSVALSADGNTAIVGGRNDNYGIGATWVLTRSGTVWSQQGNKLVGLGNIGSSFQGDKVAVSADGNTAIVGGLNDSAFKGAVWIFTRSGTTWSQQGNKLVGTESIGSTIYQGESVALSADGNTAIVGGTGDNSYKGAAWVWTRSGTIWNQQGNKLVGTGNVGAALQGYSVSLSADGNTAIVGGVNDNANQGAVWVFTRTGSNWTQQGNKLVGTGGTQAIQGSSVALSANGNTAIIGGRNDNENQGAAWVFVPAPAPTIESFTPTTGGEGTSVEIIGTNFTGATAVKFGGIAASSFKVDSDTHITAIVGPGATGAVSVTTGGGIASLDGFTYEANVEVYKAGILQTAYGNIKNAFDAINAGTHTGDLVIKINGSQVLTSTATLNANGMASGTTVANYGNITIYPTKTGLTISGTIDGSLISLNGADKLTIDGRVNGIGSNADLSFENLSSSINTNAISFAEDATNNTIKYCYLKAKANRTNGIINFASSSSANYLIGNSNNTIDHNNFTQLTAGGKAMNCIYSAAGGINNPSGMNKFNTISHNNFYDFESPEFFNALIASSVIYFLLVI
jgi:hypothetical protein